MAEEKDSLEKRCPGCGGAGVVMDLRQEMKDLPPEKPNFYARCRNGDWTTTVFKEREHAVAAWNYRSSGRCSTQELFKRLRRDGLGLTLSQEQFITKWSEED